MKLSVSRIKCKIFMVTNLLFVDLNKIILPSHEHFKVYYKAINCFGTSFVWGSDHYISSF